MSYALLEETFPIAKKPHRCCWCGEPILAGERYRREKSVYDGNWQNHAWHPECDKDFAEQCRLGDCEFTLYSADRPERAAA